MEKEDKLKIIDDLDHFLTELAEYKLGDLQIAMLRRKMAGNDFTQDQSGIEALRKRYDDIITKLQSLRSDINEEGWQSSEEGYVNDRWMESTC